jgi:hypothetical protein
MTPEETLAMIESVSAMSQVVESAATVLFNTMLVKS